MDLDFPTARLVGSNSESLSIQYHREDEVAEGINHAKLVLRIESPATDPSFDQAVET